MKHLFIAVVAPLVVTLSFVVTVQAVTCNKCNSLVDQRCISMHYEAPSCTGEGCFTFTGTASGLNVVLRDCIPNWTPGLKNGDCMPMKTQYAGVTIDGNYCFCLSYNCNGGDSKHVAAATFNPYSSRDTRFSNKGWKNAATATRDRWSLSFIFTLAIWFTV